MRAGAILLVALALLTSSCGAATTATPGTPQELTGPVAASTAPGGAATRAPGTPSSSGAASGATPIPATDPVAVAEARRIIESADLDAEDALAAVDPLRFTADGIEAARTVLEAGASEAAAWTAIWVYAAGGSDPSPLRPYLESADPSLAVMAAATLVALGDRTGLEAIGRSLSSDAVLAGSHPPRSVAAFAASTLYRYVTAAGAPTLDGADDATDIGEAWASWLAAHAATVQFDAEAGRWGTP
jgi:hypothetical protein